MSLLEILPLLCIICQNFQDYHLYIYISCVHENKAEFAVCRLITIVVFGVTILGGLLCGHMTHSTILNSEQVLFLNITGYFGRSMNSSCSLVGLRITSYTVSELAILMKFLFVTQQ